jgi:CheY-specific phosphatase CheX
MKKELIQQCARILEEWSLMLVDECDSTEIFELDEPFFLATVDFKGVVNGQVEIICQKPFADALVSNLTGEEGDPSNALREMANVFAGNLVTATFGTEHIFDLSTPEVLQKSADEVKGLLSSQTIALLGDDAPVCINVRVI